MYKLQYEASAAFNGWNDEVEGITLMANLRVRAQLLLEE
jgi:hypothetical protein